VAKIAKDPCGIGETQRTDQRARVCAPFIQNLLTTNGVCEFC
jgi:hypothetical protein